MSCTLFFMGPPLVHGCGCNVCASACLLFTYLHTHVCIEPVRYYRKRGVNVQSHSGMRVSNRFDAVFYAAQPVRSPLSVPTRSINAWYRLAPASWEQAHSARTAWVCSCARRWPQPPLHWRSPAPYGRPPTARSPRNPVRPRSALYRPNRSNTCHHRATTCSSSGMEIPRLNASRTQNAAPISELTTASTPSVATPSNALSTAR